MVALVLTIAAVLVMIVLGAFGALCTWALLNDEGDE